MASSRSVTLGRACQVALFLYAACHVAADMAEAELHQIPADLSVADADLGEGLGALMGMKTKSGRGKKPVVSTTSTFTPTVDDSAAAGGAGEELGDEDDEQMTHHPASIKTMATRINREGFEMVKSK